MIEIDRCEVCGAPMDYIRCDECDGSGRVEVLQDEANWKGDEDTTLIEFKTGVEFENCGNCDGAGGFYVCAICGQED